MSKTDVNMLTFNQARRVDTLTTLSTGTLVTTRDDIDTSSSFNKVRVSQVTSGYRGLKRAKGFRKHDLPMNRFSFVEDNRTYPLGYVRQYRPSIDNLRESRGRIDMSPLDSLDALTQSMIDDVDAKATNGSLKELQLKKADVGIFLGELGKSANTIADAAKRIAGALHEVKRGNFSAAANALGKLPPKNRRRKKDAAKQISSDWLALQYGWIPLVKDVWEIAESLASIADRPLRYRISSSKVLRWNNITNDNTWEGVPVFRRNTGSYTVKYVYYFTASRQSITDLQHFGLSNPATVLWELLPYSFVIDWFLKVGEFVDLIDASVGYSFEKGCKTTFHRESITCHANGAVPNSFNGEDFVTARSGRRYVRCERYPLGSFPLPVLRFGSGLGSGVRAVNALALIFQRLK